MIRHFFMTALKKDTPPELEETILGELAQANSMPQMVMRLIG